MSIDRLRAHFGFSKTPFSKDLAPGMLHQHRGHAEAVARVCWCIQESGLGMISGEVGSGKTVALRAATATLDPTRHTIIYLGCPGGRRPRDLRRDRRRARRQPVLSLRVADPRHASGARLRTRRARPPRGPDR